MKEKNLIFRAAFLFAFATLLIIFWGDLSCGHEWERTFSSGTDGLSVQQTNDGGYIVTGIGIRYRGSLMPESVLLMKTDVDGNELWSNSFRESMNEAGYSVQQTIDGGFIIAGEIGDFSMGNRMSISSRQMATVRSSGAKPLEKARVILGIQSSRQSMVGSSSRGADIWETI